MATPSPPAPRTVLRRGKPAPPRASLQFAPVAWPLYERFPLPSLPTLVFRWPISTNLTGGDPLIGKLEIDRRSRNGQWNDRAAWTRAVHDIKTYEPMVPPSSPGSLERSCSAASRKPTRRWMIIRPGNESPEEQFRAIARGPSEAWDTIRRPAGNSNFRDSKRRSEQAQQKGINFIELRGVPCGRESGGSGSRLIARGPRRRR